MKIISKHIAKTLCLALCGMSAISTVCAVDYTWRGTSNSVWGVSDNWLGGVMSPTNTTVAGGRLNVNNGALSPCVYDASFGTTIYSGAGRGLVIGSGGLGSGTLTINGGTLITTNAGPDIIQNTTGNTGTLNVNGGSYLSYAAAVEFGLGTGNPSTAILNVGGGYVQMGQPKFNVLSGTINYNGGITCFSNMVRTGGNITNNFNGGTVRALANTSAAFIPSSVTLNVRDGGAVIDTAGFSITIASPLAHSVISGDAAIDGGLIKNGLGTLTFSSTGTNTYTGPTVVNQGSLVGVKLPSSSTSLTLADGTAVSITVNDSSWTPTSVNVTNATLNFAFGGVVSLPSSIITGALTASGSNVVNITSGAGLPIGVTKLIDHGGKLGGGTFTLGTLPAGLQATLTDGPTSVDLNVTSSVQSLIWSAGTAEWATNGNLNWNSGTAAYTEYPSGAGDIVTFNDTAGVFYTVSITNDVKPLDVVVSIPTAAVTFNGDGKITGSTGLSKSGAGILTLANTNSYDGATLVTGGTLQVINGAALGSTVGSSSASGGATLALGDGVGTGVTVTGETLTISGAGVGGARGVLRGVDSGNNVWAGPVIIGANEARIGTEDGGNLTLSGPITEAATNLTLIIRAGANGTVTISGIGSSYGQTRTYGDQSATGIIKVGADDAFATNGILALGLGFVDLNGFNQTVAGLYDVAGPGTINNNGGSPSTLTINTGTNNFGSGGSIVDVASTVSLVKLGSGTQSLYGAALSYSGTTTVSEGRLDLYVASMSSAITVASGATLAGEPTTTGSLTLSANASLIADPSTPASLTADTINASTSPINVSFSSAFPPGDVLVLTAPSGITGSAANFQAVGVRGSGSFYLANANTELYFTPPANATLVWKGNDATSPTFWDVTTTTNWDNSGSPDMFYTSDAAVFNDTASTLNVAVQGGVLPISVTFNNSASNYVVSGGAISGITTVAKSGSGTVTLANNSSYTGVTTITDGTLIIQNGSALGSTNGGTIISGTGTLDFNTGAASGNALNIGRELLTISGTGFGGNGAIVNNSGVADQINAVQQVALAGDASIGGVSRWDMRGTGNALDMGGFNLTKTGANYVAMVGTLISNPGNIEIANGTLGLQLANDLGGSAANTITVQNGGTLSFYQYQLPGAWTLTLNSNATVKCESYNAGNNGTNHWIGPALLNGPVNFLLNSSMSFGSGIGGTGSIIKTSSGYLRLYGTNSYTGDTTINGGRIVFFTASIGTNTTVTVTNGAQVDLQFVETNAVDGLVLGGVAKGPGVYNNTTDASFILGTGSLLVAGSLIPTTPTNLTYSVTSSNITLSWPGEYTGWSLQTQTNTLNVGLSTNWADVVGSELTNTVTLPVSLTDPSVFFRMIYTNAP